MNTDDTRTRARIWRTLLDTVQSLLVIAAVAGQGWWVYHLTLHSTWTVVERLLTGAATAGAVGLAVNGIVGVALTRVRVGLDARAYGPFAADRTDDDDSFSIFAGPGPRSLCHALLQAEEATSVDAAKRAASEAFQLDRGRRFLRNADRWRGYPDGEATFVLADGLVLHFAMVDGAFGTDAHYTLLTDDGDQPVAITSLAQLRHLLDARHAGLPLAPARPTGEREDRPEPVAV
ncbi:hypothetical protein ACEZDB_35870 [Streptacidiphilus sp. N1-3]|uniref:Uncharacterized protein n=1 Tax=Streptacidiphilus alkalitolerans TaxID=3342712 RepID=A0ABV6XCK8_9ACTN